MDQSFEKIPRMREESLCPCYSPDSYAKCCMLFHYGRATPATAEQLMRSRYTAYFFRLTNYLVDTTHPDTRSPRLKAELEETIGQVKWRHLEVIDTVKGGPEDKVGKVEFIAKYNVEGEAETYELHERSRFKRFKGKWKYLDGKS